MPGSYRILNHIQKASSAEKAKIVQESVEEEEMSSLSENKDSPDGKWNEQQNYKFTIFVNYYQHIFTSKHKRKTCKIFKIFAQFLHPRTPTQCRSHFQKMMAKHKSITKLKKYYKTLVGQSDYRKELTKFRHEWELNHQPLETTYPQIKETKQFAVQTEPLETPPALCSNCRNIEPRPISPPQPQFYPINPIVYWSQGNPLQQMLGGNYVMWLPNTSQEAQLP